MTLVSPGVEVTVIDQSNYLPAATNSVPFILIATAQNKISGTGTGVAPGTIAANADTVYLITSQRDLAATFGNPFFYKTSDGAAINGYELNEYGLLAANSVLGISNRAYVQRANIDLSTLTATLVRPTGVPNNGTYWLDTSESMWGISEWNQTTSAFTVQTPIVITSTTELTGSAPAASVGSIGNYAVVATNANNPIYYKNSSNSWVLVGSDLWKESWPTVQGTNTITGQALTASDVLEINGTNCAVPASPNNTLAGLVGVINGHSIAGIIASADSSNRLVITASEAANTHTGEVVIGASTTAGLATTLGVTVQTYQTPQLDQTPNYTVPRWRTTDSQPAPTGSVWIQTTVPNQGSEIIVKVYNSSLATWITSIVPLYSDDQSANADLDPAGGGKSIAVGTLYAEYNSSPQYVSPYFNNTATLTILERLATGSTIVTGATADPTFASGNAFTIATSQANSTSLTSPVTVTIGGTGTPADFVAAVSAANIPNVSASVAPNGAIVFTQSLGGVISLVDGSGNPLAAAGFTTALEQVRAVPTSTSATGGLLLSNWVQLSYIASPIAPDQNPASGTPWYYSAVNQVDIMIQNNGAWSGYRTVNPDVRGYNLTLTDANGPQISVTAPITQSTGGTLAYGDLWIDSSDLELYPVINRWENVNGVDQWVAIDNTDHTTINGVIFEDARWAPNGTTDPIADNYPTIQSLLISNYLDLDAPSPDLYADGTLLWNTRRSGYNVKEFQAGYFNAATFSVPYYDPTTTYSANETVLYNGVIYVYIGSTAAGHIPTNTTYWAELQTNAWVTASGKRADGAPYMGRFAQRSLIVAALKSAIDTQQVLREEQNVFNLIACPQYPELIPNMIALNNERSNTAFVVGDTPLRMGPDSASIADWVTDANGLGNYAADGLTISDPYTGVFYPSCQTTDLSGTIVVQPPSHMMLRTIIRSDEIAYPWLAPAGTRRGLVDNATAIGYVNAQTGAFVTTATGQVVRDILYTNNINPITYIPGTGITNYGNKTISAVTSALDRINVARLVAYIRARLITIGKNYVFEPNDQTTRNQITNDVTSMMIDLVAKRGLYDYLVVCDSSNNTPARIDNNELWVDIAIEPVKAVEFIYIPVRIMNTGAIASGGAPLSV